MGLAEIFLGKDNPFAQWVGQNQNLVGAIGGGLGQGQNIQSGISAGLAQVPQAKALDYQMNEKTKADAKVEAQTNATKLWLQQNHPDLAQAVDGGLSISDAWNEAFERMRGSTKAAEPFTLGPDQVRYNPDGSVLAQGPAAPVDNKDAFSMEKDLTSQYLGTDPVKSYQAVRNGYEKVRTAATNDSGPGDISMIFAYMKMLDPTSVVREGEFATAENAGGVGQQISNLYNKLLTGERLTPELRKQFLKSAEQMYADTASNLSDINSQFSTRAGAWEVDPTRFIISPESYQPLRLGARKVVDGKTYVQDENGDWYEE